MVAWVKARRDTGMPCPRCGNPKSYVYDRRVGCASNVPDPRKRRQVEQSRDAAVSMREFFAREGLKADVRKHEEVIHDHDLFLREMRSIEEYRTEGFFQVRLESGSR